MHAVVCFSVEAIIRRPSSSVVGCGIFLSRSSSSPEAALSRSSSSAALISTWTFYSGYLISAVEAISPKRDASHRCLTFLVTVCHVGRLIMIRQPCKVTQTVWVNHTNPLFIKQTIHIKTHVMYPQSHIPTIKYDIKVGVWTWPWNHTGWLGCH